MRTPKFTDDQLVVDRAIHNYLTMYGYDYNEDDQYYCFLGRSAKDKPIFMVFYDPLKEKLTTWLKVSDLDEYNQCIPYINSYYRRKKYLQKKGLIDESK